MRATIPPTVAVVTLTRNRPESLARAIASVEAQDHPAVEHWIVADRCDVYSDPVARRAVERAHTGVTFLHNDERTEDYLPSHCGQLRSRAAKAATTDLVAFLDDDNTYEQHHLSSVVRSMQKSGEQAGHSWRTLWTADGRPWRVSDADPWSPDPRLARLAFHRLSALGVLREGDNVVRDRALHDGRPGLVDTNEWVLKRELLLFYSTGREVTRAERRLKFTEDTMLTRDLARAGVPVACSREATVRYTMGGYSNENVARVPLEGLA